MELSLPKVSVITITYNHEKYILETIKGVLKQNYSGPIEFIIANDNSPDKTDEIVINYLKKTEIPTNVEIKYTKHIKNKGVNSNFYWALKQATGKYITICEGDDYWINSNKLKLEVDFLEKKPEFIMCFTNRICKLGEELIENSELVYDKSEFEYSDLPLHVPTLTRMYRNSSKIDYEWLKKIKYAAPDYLLTLQLFELGKVKYINETTAVYRQGVGIYSGIDYIRRREFDILTYLGVILLVNDKRLIEFHSNELLRKVINSLSDKNGKMSFYRINEMLHKNKKIPFTLKLKLRALKQMNDVRNDGKTFGSTKIKNLLFKVFLQ